MDNYTGDSTDNIITGVVGTGATLAAYDAVNGGAGTDTLRIYTDAGVVLPTTFTSIEKLLINDNVHQSIDLSAPAYVSAGVTELTLQGGTTVNAAKTTVTLGAGQSKLTLDGVTDGDATAATLADGGLEVATLATTATVAGTPTLDLSLNNVGAATANTAVHIDLATAALTTLNVTATGKNNVILGNVGAGLSKLTVAGAGDLNASYAALAVGVKTIDAATASGKVTLDVSGASVRTITGGTGDDTFIFGANYIGAEAADATTRDVVNGGTGNDTVSMTVARAVAASAANQTNLTSIEGLTISDEWTTGKAIDVTKFADVTTVTLADTTKSASGTSTMTVKSGTTIVLAGDTHTDAVTTFAIGGTGTTDSLTIKTQGFDWKTGGTAKLATTGVETLTLDTGLSAAGTAVIDGTTTMTPSAGGTAKIVVQGDGAMTFTGVVTASEIDASALKGILTVTGTPANAITIKGGTKADVINGSASNDLITGNGGADVITAAAGNDSINLSDTDSAVDTVKFSGSTTNALTLAANGFDTITNFGTNDIINVKALGNGTQAGGIITVSAAGAIGAFTDGANYILNVDGGVAGSLTTGGTAKVTDFTSMTQVAAFLSERFSHTASTADEEMVVVWNVGTTSYVYNVDTNSTLSDSASV